LLAALAYLGWKLVEDPRNQLFGKTLVSGPKNEPLVALTFDDGPNPPYTERILDVLARERVHATFFVVGRAVEAYPQTVRRIVREGHALGNHSWDHAHYVGKPALFVQRDLARTDDALARVAHVRPRLMRPPFGQRDFSLMAQAKRDGYTVVMWSDRLPDDWEQPGDATIASRVVSRVRDGSIIVLHDGNRGLLCAPAKLPPRTCDRTQEIAATREIIDALHAEGYRFVTIPELLAENARAAAQGK
jgi:peptidoglycan/xylan/chitin deacetylase (PgdA/CDA1 family)